MVVNTLNAAVLLLLSDEFNPVVFIHPDCFEVKCPVMEIKAITTFAYI